MDKEFNEMLVDAVKEKLHNGEASFTYQKKNGEIRSARGTLVLENIPDEQKPTGLSENVRKDTIAYYDLELKAWRSFKPENLLTVAQ